jgi:hypothetical protein
VGKFLEHLIIGLAWVAVIGAGAYFGGPIIWAHAWSAIQAGEAAKVTAHAQAGALAADTTAANRQQQSCSAEIAAAGRSAAAVAAASRPVPAAAGQPQPLITADQIRAIMQ